MSIKVTDRHGLAVPQGKAFAYVQPPAIKKAEECLGATAPYAPKARWKHIAFVGCDKSLIQNSSYDHGMTPYDSLCANREYLEYLKQIGCFFPFKDHERVISGALSILNGLVVTLGLYANKKKPLSTAELKEKVTGYKTYVNKLLDAQQPAYFAFHYNDEKRPHALSCKIVRDAHTTTISFFNLGAGSEGFPHLHATSTHYRISYSYYPMQMTNAEWEERQDAFFSQIARYYCDEHKNYSSQELYEMLAVMGKLKPDLIVKHADDLHAKQQVVGDCAEKSIRMILNDYIKFHSGLSRADQTKFFLNLYFAVFLTGYHDIRKEAAAAKKILLLNAIEEFALHLLRARPLVAGDQLAHAAEMLGCTLDATNRVVAEEGAKVVGSSVVSTALAKAEHPKTVALDLAQKKAPKPEEFVTFAPFDPRQFKKILQEGLSAPQSKYEGYSLIFFVATLPIPRWDDPDDVWNQVPPEHIEEIINLFYKLSTRACDHTIFGSRFLTLCTLHTIMDKLQRRLPDSKLRGLSARFLPDYDDSIVHFNTVQEEMRYGLIKSYFEKQSQALPPADTIANTHHLNQAIDSCYRQLETQIQLHRRHREATHNQVRFAQADPEDPVPWKQTFIEKLLPLMRSPRLRVGTALHFLETQYHNLGDVHLQHAILNSLFSQNTLKRCIDENPALIEEFRKIIDRGMNVTTTQDPYQRILFFIRVGILLETRVDHYFPAKSDTARWLDFKAKLKKLRESYPLSTHQYALFDRFGQICKEELFCANAWKEENVAFFVESYANIFHFQSYQVQVQFDTKRFAPHDWYHLRFSYFLRMNRFLALQGAKKNEVYAQICTGIIAHFLKDKTPPNLRWDFTRPFSPTAGPFQLEFMTGKIRHTQFDATFFQALSANDYDIDKAGFAPSQLWWTIDEQHHQLFLTFEDDTKGCVYDKSSKRCIPFKRGKDELKVTAKVIMPESCRFTSHFPVVSYEMLPSAPGTTSVLATCDANRTPYCRIDYTADKTVVTRLNARGETTPLQLCNLDNISSEHPHYSRTVAIAPARDIACYIDTRTDSIEELYFRGTPGQQGLQFQRTEFGLESMQYRGYYFTQKRLSTLGALSEKAIVLQNHRTGRFKVILVAPRYETRMLGEREVKDLPEVPFHVYDLKAEHDPIASKRLEDRLFLIYFFKAHGDVNRAMMELKKINMVDKNEINSGCISVLCHFFPLKDRSTAAVALNMRLAFFIADHFSSFDRDAFTTAPALLTAIAYDWHVDYHQVGSVPKEFQFTELQERRVLTTYSREKIKLPPIIETRMNCYKAKDRTAEVVFTPIDVPLVPNCYTQVCKPAELNAELPAVPAVKPEIIAFPNRLDFDYLAAHFVGLYEDARRMKAGTWHPFDLTLLALLKNDDKRMKPLASLLFYVRHFPEEFAALPLANPADFQRILEKAKTLARHPRYETFVKEVISAKTRFDYSKTVKVTLPAKPAVGESALPPVAMKVEKQPFKASADLLFKVEEGETIGAERGIFDQTVFKKQNLLHTQLLKKYEKANRELLAKKSARPVLQRAKLPDVRASLKTQAADLAKRQKERAEHLDACLNNPYQAFGIKDAAGEREFRLQLHAGQTYRLTAEMIMKEVILNGNCALLLEERAFLKPQFQAIIQAVHEYYHNAVLLLRLEKAVQLAESGSETDLFDLYTLLNYEFLYDPVAYPEISYFCVKTGKLPRPDQWEAYKWMCEGLERGENRLLQMAAGGGKTSYLIPLFILRCKRHPDPVVPFVFSTQSMFAIDRENLAAVLQLVGEELGTLHIDMHSDLSLKDLSMVYHDLNEHVHRRKALILTPGTFYALRLLYFATATDPKEKERADKCAAIFRLLKTHGVPIIDEAHRNLNPLTQAVYGVGKWMHVEEQERSAIFTLMRPVMEMLHQKEAVVQRSVAQTAAVSLFKHLSEGERKALVQFWMKEAPMNIKLSEQDLQMAYLVRHFIFKLLPEVLKMQREFDHQMSEECGEIETPAYRKMKTHSQFQNPLLALALTIKGTMQRGLNVAQMTKAIKLLQELDREERKYTLGTETRISRRFQSWTKAVDVRALNVNKEADMLLAHRHLSHCRQLIEMYITHEVSPHIGFAEEQFTSSPTHLMQAFKCSVLTSATPMDPLAHPRALAQTKPDENFEAQVLATAVQPRNQRFMRADSIRSFFDDIRANRAHFAKHRALIDAGGFLSEAPNKEVAQMWLDASGFDAILYFKEGGDEKLCLLMKNGETIEFAKGSDHLKEELQGFGYDWDRLIIGVLFDAAHAESANIILPPDTRAFVCASPTLTLTHAIQSIMRLRGFNAPHMRQTIEWVMPRSMYGIDANTLFSRCLKNEARATRAEVIMAALQQITFEIEEAAISGPNPHELMQKNQKGFKRKVQLADLWADIEKADTTPGVLVKYATDTYQRFAFVIALKDNPALKQAMNEIIGRAVTKIKKISTLTSHASGVHQKVQVNVIVQQKQFKRAATDDLKPAPVAKRTSVASPDYPATLKKEHLAQEVYGLPTLTRDLYVDPNQFNTALRDGVSVKTEFLKRIDFILITQHDGHLRAEILSNDSAEEVYKELNSAPAAATHQSYMIRANGSLYVSGKGALAPRQGFIDIISRTPWMKSIVEDVAFLNGHSLLPPTRAVPKQDIVRIWDALPRANTFLLESCD